MIRYEANSFAGPIDEDELEAIWDHIDRNPQDDDRGLPAIDSEYLVHIQQFHGGMPIGCMIAQWQVKRFLNFVNPFIASDPNRLYNVNLNRRLIEDRLYDLQIPFATLAHGNYLLLDYATHPASVVYWCHEKSEFGSPWVEQLASSFREFVAIVSECE